MSNSRMVDAVNQLVVTLLTGSGEVFMPGIGSLYVERRSAQKVTKRSVIPPYRMVSFSSQQRGVSLVERIAATATVEMPQAEEIYQTWLARTYKEEVLTIEGVGVLKFKNFTLTPEFDAALNPQGHEPIRVKASRGVEWPLWIGVVAIVFAAVAGAYQYWVLKHNGKSMVTKVEREVVQEVVTIDGAAAVDSVQLSVGVVEPTDSAVQIVVPVVQAEAELADAEVSAAPRRLESGRRYVVLGVFSTVENARNAARAAQIPCRIYNFGNKFLVSPFESEQAAACTEFIGEHASRFPDLWTHAAR